MGAVPSGLLSRDQGEDGVHPQATSKDAPRQPGGGHRQNGAAYDRLRADAGAAGETDERDDGRQSPLALGDGVLCQRRRGSACSERTREGSWPPVADADSAANVSGAKIVM